MYLGRNNAMNVEGFWSDRNRVIHQAPQMLLQAAPVFEQFAQSIAQMQSQLPVYQNNLPTYTTMTVPNKRGPPPLVCYEYTIIFKEL
jgi:hypothetical protein